MATFSPELMELFAKLQQARDTGKEQRLIGNMGQAFSTANAALSGTKPDLAFDRSLVEQAGIPEAQAQKDISTAITAGAAADKARLAEEKADLERTYKDWLIKKIEADMVDKDRKGDQTDRRLTEQERNNRDRAALARKRAEDAAKRGSGVDNRNVNASVQKLGEKTAKIYSEFAAAFRDLEGAQPGLVAGNVPEKFQLSAADKAALRMPMGVGTKFVSPPTVALLKQVQNIRDLISRARSGAVLNEGEEKHYRSLISDDVLADPSALASGLKLVRDGIAQKLRDQQLPFGEAAAPGLESLTAYERGGGTSYRDPIWGLLKDGKPYPWPTPDAAPAPTEAPPLPTDVPVKEPTRIEKDGRFYEQDENGDWFEVE